MKAIAIAIFDSYNCEQSVYLYKVQNELEIFQKLAAEPWLWYCSEDIKKMSSLEEFKDYLDDELVVDIKSIEI